VQIWQQVKGTHPGLSVCEVGATIGRMWRELSDFQKQQFNEDFAHDKVLLILTITFFNNLCVFSKFL